MRRLPLIAALALLSCTASAQSVYKCRDGKGVPVYQSEPCANAEKRWDAKPEPPPSYDEVRARELTRQRQEAESAQLRRAAGRDRPQQSIGANLPAYAGSDPGRCERAKRHRQQVLDQVGLKRNFDLLRKLDDMVYNACK